MDDEIEFESWPAAPATVEGPAAEIPLEEPPGAGSEAEGERPGRRGWKVAAVVVVVLAVVGGAMAIAVQQRSTAADWRDVANGLEDELDATNEELATRTEERDQAAGERDTAQARVAELETQLANVANEKARLGDERESLRQLIEITPTINAAMRACAAANAEVATSALELASSPDGSPASLQALIDEANEVCSEANDLAGSLQEVVDGLTS